MTKSNSDHSLVSTSIYLCLCLLHSQNHLAVGASQNSTSHFPYDQGLTTMRSIPTTTKSSFVFRFNESLTQSNSCKPREYIQRGYCTKYFTCNRKTRLEIKRSCSDGLFWNPNVNSIHGGVCDYLRNIEKDTLFEYKKDTKCVLDVAYFRVGGECSAKYFFNHPTRTQGKEVEEFCPDGLVWSKDKESCDICSMVTKKDGKTPCCDHSDSDY